MVFHNEDFKLIVNDQCSIEIVKAPIEMEKTDVIVNCATRYLMHETGDHFGTNLVAGPLIKRGGKSIVEESDKLVEDNHSYMVGDAVVTTAGDLDCKHLIHAIVPAYRQFFPPRSHVSLTKTVNNALDKANSLDGIESISIPALSAYQYRFPVDESAQIILWTCLEWLMKH